MKRRKDIGGPVMVEALEGRRLMSGTGEVVMTEWTGSELTSGDTQVEDGASTLQQWMLISKQRALR